MSLTVLLIQLFVSIVYVNVYLLDLFRKHKTIATEYKGVISHFKASKRNYFRIMEETKDY